MQNRHTSQRHSNHIMLDLDECIERCCAMELLEEDEVSELCERLKQILMVLGIAHPVLAAFGASSFRRARVIIGI